MYIIFFIKCILLIFFKGGESEGKNLDINIKQAKTGNYFLCTFRKKTFSPEVSDFLVEGFLLLGPIVLFAVVCFGLPVGYSELPVSEWMASPDFLEFSYQTKQKKCFK